MNRDNHKRTKQYKKDEMECTGMDLSDTGSHKKEYRQNGFLDIEVISYMPDFVGQRYLLKKNAQIIRSLSVFLV